MRDDIGSKWISNLNGNYGALSLSLEQSEATSKEPVGIEPCRVKGFKELE